MDTKAGGGRLRRGVDPHSTNFLSFFFFLVSGSEPIPAPNPDLGTALTPLDRHSAS